MNKSTVARLIRLSWGLSLAWLCVAPLGAAAAFLLRLWLPGLFAEYFVVKFLMVNSVLTFWLLRLAEVGFDDAAYEVFIEFGVPVLAVFFLLLAPALVVKIAAAILSDLLRPEPTYWLDWLAGASYPMWPFVIAAAAIVVGYRGHKMLRERTTAVSVSPRT